MTLITLRFIRAPQDERYTSNMFKLIAILIFSFFCFLLNKIKRKKYPKLKNLNYSIVKLSIIAAIWGVLLGLAGAYKITYYSNFDPNFDLFLIISMVLFIIYDLVIAGLILTGKGNWLLSNNEKV